MPELLVIPLDEREVAVKWMRAFLDELEGKPCAHRLAWGTCFNCLLAQAQEAADA